MQIEPPSMDRMRDGLSSPARWRRSPRCWICVVLYESTIGKLVLYGSTTGRPPWPPLRWEKVGNDAPRWRRHVGLRISFWVLVKFWVRGPKLRLHVTSLAVERTGW